MNAAICIVAYNRLQPLKRLLQSLLQAYYQESITLIISVDKSDTTEVEDYAKLFNWPYGAKRVILHEKNLGLRRHVLGIGNFLDEFDAVIVLEDDISVAPNFCNYALCCVKEYNDNDNIAGISLYNFPLNYHNGLPFVSLHSNSDVFLMQNAMSWGQVWMRKQWKDFIDWYKTHSEEFSFEPHLPESICSWGKSSWLKYHTKYCIERNKYFVYPYISLSTNNSEEGVHNSVRQTLYQTPLLYGEKVEYNLNATIKYDSFFESELIYEVLGKSKEELCVDFYGLKKNRLKRRYYLTRERLDYKIVAAYSLLNKPYEMNVVNNNKGDELFLYDTLQHEKFKKWKIKNRICHTMNFYEFLYSLKIKSFFKMIVKKMVK